MRVRKHQKQPWQHVLWTSIVNSELQFWPKVTKTYKRNRFMNFGTCTSIHPAAKSLQEQQIHSWKCWILFQLTWKDVTTKLPMKFVVHFQEQRKLGKHHRIKIQIQLKCCSPIITKWQISYSGVHCYYDGAQLTCLYWDGWSTCSTVWLTWVLVPSSFDSKLQCIWATCKVNAHVARVQKKRVFLTCSGW